MSEVVIRVGNSMHMHIFSLLSERMLTWYVSELMNFYQFKQDFNIHILHIGANGD